MSNKQGYEELIAFAQEKGYYDQNYVARDLEIDWEYTLSQENAPTEYGFGLSSMRFDFFLQGELGKLQILESYKNPNNWPSHDYQLYLKRENQPIVPIALSGLYFFVAEKLEPEQYRFQAVKAQNIWDALRYAGQRPPENWPDYPCQYAERCWINYTDALRHRDQFLLLKIQRMEREEAQNA